MKKSRYETLLAMVAILASHSIPVAPARRIKDSAVHVTPQWVHDAKIADAQAKREKRKAKSVHWRQQMMAAGKHV